MAMNQPERPVILDGLHYCDRAGEHRNDECYQDVCVCSLCGEFWHWNIRRWDQAVDVVKG
jgi:hypothetical protein